MVGMGRVGLVHRVLGGSAPIPTEDFSILNISEVYLRCSETISGPSRCGVKERFFANVLPS